MLIAHRERIGAWRGTFANRVGESSNGDNPRAGNSSAVRSHRVSNRAAVASIGIGGNCYPVVGIKHRPGATNEGAQSNRAVGSSVINGLAVGGKRVGAG